MRDPGLVKKGEGSCVVHAEISLPLFRFLTVNLAKTRRAAA